MENVTLGIIGPGNLTATMLTHAPDFAQHLDGILLYDYGGSKRFEGTFRAHRENMLSGIVQVRDTEKREELLEGRKRFEPTSTESFPELMSRSDVIILNVGRLTTDRFLGEGYRAHPFFESLEGILEREAQKEGKPLGRMVAEYFILKEVEEAVSADMFKEVMRLSWMLPATLPIVMKYAHRMRAYFDESGVDPASKLLIVNSNSSENCLNGVLSVIPEWSEAAVSLAIDSARLNLILNLDKEIQDKLPAGVYLQARAVCDHDAHMIPDLENARQALSRDTYEPRMDEFMGWFKENYAKLYSRVETDLRGYYQRRKESMVDLRNQAAVGNRNILLAVFENDSLESGFFHENYGVCLVGTHTLSRKNGKFKVNPVGGKLSGISEEKFREGAHGQQFLQQRLFGDKRIPVFGPAEERHESPEDIEAALVEAYHRIPRKHTELLIPVAVMDGPEYRHFTQGRLVALDLGDLSTREVAFTEMLGAVSSVKIDGEQKICVGVGNGVVILNTDFSEEKRFELSVSSPITTIYTHDNQMFAGHPWSGLFEIDCSTGDVEQVSKRGCKDIKMVGDLLYFATESGIYRRSPDGSEERCIPGNITAFAVVEGEIYAALRPRASQAMHYLHTSRGALESLGEIQGMTHYIVPTDEGILISERKRLRVLVDGELRKVCGLERKINGVVHDVHTYVSERNTEVRNVRTSYTPGGNCVWEIDRFTGKKEVITADAVGENELITTTLAVLHTVR